MSLSSQGMLFVKDGRSTSGQAKEANLLKASIHTIICSDSTGSGKSLGQHHGAGRSGPHTEAGGIQDQGNREGAAVDK